MISLETTSRFYRLLRPESERHWRMCRISSTNLLLWLMPTNISQNGTWMRTKCSPSIVRVIRIWDERNERFRYNPMWWIRSRTTPPLYLESNYSMGTGWGGSTSDALRDGYVQIPPLDDNNSSTLMLTAYEEVF